MNKIITLFVLILMSAAVYAESENPPVSPKFQQQNLFGGDGFSIGGCGGPVFRGTFINNQLYFSSGGEGYAIINHTFLIGGGGYGTPLRYSYSTSDKGISGIGWGGLILGYIFFPEAVVHPYIKTLIGAGGIGYVSNNTEMDGAAFFVMEGEAGAEINVIDWVRVCPYIGYHFAAGSFNINGITDANISGWHFGIMVRFGAF